MRTPLGRVQHELDCTLKKLSNLIRNQQKISDAIKLKKWKENMNLVSLCEFFYYDLDVTQNALEKASAGGKYTTWQQGDPF